MNTTPRPELGTARCPYVLDATGADIHAEGRELRARGPATPVALPGDVRAWAVTDTALAKRLLIDSRVSKDAYRHWPDFIRGEIPDSWPLRIWVDVRNALTSYGAEHTRLRRLIGAAFTARRARAISPQVERIAHQLLDELADLPPGEPVDLRERFIWRLPLHVLSVLLGVPDSMHDAFREAADGIFDTDLTTEQAAANSRTAYALIDELIAVKRAEPGTDVTSTLVGTCDENGGCLSEDELRDSLLLLICAGHETVVNLLGHAVVNVLTHPYQLALVRTAQSTWADVVDETLRHQAPIAHIPLRYATDDIHDRPSGLTVLRGEPILLSYSSAGRDPLVHGADADAFDITRSTRREHLSLGYGTHYCLGAELARCETRIALTALFARFPHLSLAVPSTHLKPLESFVSNGHQAIPVLLG
ncbi:cytochrome P450 [Streptomyces sp. NPDC050504]|uniref:cytochrome P450 n=1 Tax=Streptomyces sp. NPDC050504 TaxID=3365618 RepID=UPI0037A2F3FF